MYTFASVISDGRPLQFTTSRRCFQRGTKAGFVEIGLKIAQRIREVLGNSLLLDGLEKILEGQRREVNFALILLSADRFDPIEAVCRKRLKICQCNKHLRAVAIPMKRLQVSLKLSVHEPVEVLGLDVDCEWMLEDEAVRNAGALSRLLPKCTPTTSANSSSISVLSTSPRNFGFSS